MNIDGASGWVRTAAILAMTSVVAGCIGGAKNAATGAAAGPPVINTLAVTVDAGPAAAGGAINHAYVTVTVCVPGSTARCSTIDHVLLDTGSWGLRVVRSVLDAGAVALVPETDSQGRTIEECATFGSGQTWGPVAAADVTLAGEFAAAVPTQILDDTNGGAPAPATCGAGGTLINGVTDWSANGVLGVGVFAEDCGPACVDAATPMPIYYGCTAAGACAAENVPLTSQVTNPATKFAADNNGLSIDMPNLTNANGDSTVQGKLTFGLLTQSDNPLPATGLTLLGADANGDFLTTYHGAAAPVPAIIDSGTDSYEFDDPSLAICTSAAWVGYYCPTVAPQPVSAVNASAASTAANVLRSSDTVNFAIADPDTFATAAAAFDGLAGGAGASNFIWGMPFFYGRTIYIGFEARTAGSFTGPFYAY